MTQLHFLYLFLILAIIWVAIWLFVVRSTPQKAAEEPISQKAQLLRERLLFPVCAALLILFALSVYFAPYQRFRERTIGEPEMTVKVESLQWAWILEDQQIPSKKVIEFDVTSKDVNHDFAIFSPDGKILTQAQAMPGYTNKLVWKFDEPGEYTIRCLEYCGIGHHTMILKLNVV